MENQYYIIPIEDKGILLYSELVEKKPTFVNNGKEFVCKTYLEIKHDEVMSVYPRFTKKGILQYIETTNKKVEL